MISQLLKKHLLLFSPFADYIELNWNVYFSQQQQQQIIILHKSTQTVTEKGIGWSFMAYTYPIPYPHRNNQILNQENK